MSASERGIRVSWRARASCAGKGSARTLHPAPRQGRSEGYTLVELLVSLVILGTLVGGLGLALSTGLDADERARREGERAQEIRLIINALRADIQHAALTPGSERSWLIGSDESDGDRDTDTLRLTTRSRRISLGRLELLESSSPAWEETRDADWSAVTYSLAPLDTGEGLGLFRREQTPPGIDPLEELGEEELLSDAVTGFNVRFFDGEAWADAWDTTEEGSGVLPRVIEVTLDLFGGDGEENGVSVTAAFPIRALPPVEATETDEDATSLP
ncbi:MAG TPA: type II secretion system protein GspJ [Armatimonadota bacterium]|nr:prepilin-type N-terminal cleavage/methylation domain-containing protein [Armatimonadota bacterium]HOJ21682.1 type II secretion system protein GspJ [Armatimonadota bacterium]HOM80697.1 type II secretion system protein GspJ [Armatimonadota bacterium]HOQ28684.1 type II secretion system protein GspJ [Armatimonadota bacterium]HPO73836.1 type II secretion system protein GspJ [Armatimonadota bacterium]